MEEPGRELDVTSPFRELRCNTVLACNTPLVQIPFRLRCDSTQVRCPRCSSYARPCPPRACPSPWARHNIHATTVHVTTSTSPQPCPSGPPACSPPRSASPSLRCTQLPASRCALSECFDPCHHALRRLRPRRARHPPPSVRSLNSLRSCTSTPHEVAAPRPIPPSRSTAAGRLGSPRSPMCTRRARGVLRLAILRP